MLQPEESIRGKPQVSEKIENLKQVADEVAVFLVENYNALGETGVSRLKALLEQALNSNLPPESDLKENCCFMHFLVAALEEKLSQTTQQASKSIEPVAETRGERVKAEDLALKFLEIADPTMLRQLLSTKDLTVSFRLLAYNIREAAETITNVTESKVLGNVINIPVLARLIWLSFHLGRQENMALLGDSIKDLFLALVTFKDSAIRKKILDLLKLLEHPFKELFMLDWANKSRRSNFTALIHKFAQVGLFFQNPLLLAALPSSLTFHALHALFDRERINCGSVDSAQKSVTSNDFKQDLSPTNSEKEEDKLRLAALILQQSYVAAVVASFYQRQQGDICLEKESYQRAIDHSGYQDFRTNTYTDNPSSIETWRQLVAQPFFDCLSENDRERLEENLKNLNFPYLGPILGTLRGQILGRNMSDWLSTDCFLRWLGLSKK